MKQPETQFSAVQPRGNASPRKGASRRWLPWAGVTLLAGLLVAGFWPKPAPVETAAVSKGPLRVTVDEEGKTRVRQRYVVFAPVAGQLQRAPFKAGAEVVEGRTDVAVIEPLSPAMLDERARNTALARRETAVARLAKARAELDFSISELARFERLHAEKTISTREFEAAQLQKTASERDVAAAESELKQAEAELAEFEPGRPSDGRNPRVVLAPVSGRVLRVFEESARAVTAGMPLLEIGDPADIEAVVEALSRDGAIIQPGMPAELEQWGGGQPLEARVRLVEPAGFTKISALGVEEQRVNVILDLLTPPEQRGNLGDNFRVEARIIVWQASDVIKAPAGAFFRQGNGWAVYIIDNGRARLRNVTVGRSSGAETQALDGLAEGDKVIIYPGGKVREGMRVREIVIESDP
jgi:HlyD family secretion protein